MAASVREDLLSAGLAVFDREGFEGATIAAIRKQARASNGSFFHVFASKKDLAGGLFLGVLGRDHAANLTALGSSSSALRGIEPWVPAQLDWVATKRRQAGDALGVG